MNLGDIYIKTFFTITAASFIVGFVCAFSIRFIRRTYTGWLVPLGLLLGAVSTVVANGVFHRELFTAWHQSQNKVVPQTGCLTYEPAFDRLHATYSMNSATFDKFVNAHPWGLLPYDSSLEIVDAQRLGFDRPDAAYATEMAPNGNQLRVYFENGTMFLSYNVM